MTTTVSGKRTNHTKQMPPMDKNISFAEATIYPEVELAGGTRKAAQTMVSHHLDYYLPLQMLVAAAQNFLSKNPRNSSASAGVAALTFTISKTTEDSEKTVLATKVLGTGKLFIIKNS